MVRGANSRWERWEALLSTWLPYVALAIPTLLSLLQGGQTYGARVWVAALVALAGAWVYALHTRAPEPRVAHSKRMAVYFAGMLALGAALMTRQPIFFVFTLTGFFHATLLRPWPLMVLGVALTSILVNTLITGFPWPTREGWLMFGTIIAIQTSAISFGMAMSERMATLSEGRRQALARLEAAMQENAGLQAQLLTQAREAGILDERQRMAHEIHDTLAQGLTGIIAQLEAAEQATRQPDRWRRHIGKASELARASLAEARRSVEALQPAPLEQVPLPQALAHMARQWADTTGVTLQLEITGVVQPLLPEIEAALFRVAQEALANVAKHARAGRVGVTLSYMEDIVVLDVRDDGVGFVLDEAPAGARANVGQGFGLRGMQQRLQRVAGSLSVESAPGDGVALSATVPALSALHEKGVL